MEFCGLRANFSQLVCHSSFFLSREIFGSKNKPKNNEHVSFGGYDYDENKRFKRFCQNLHPRVQNKILRERGILRKKFSTYTVQSRSGKFATLDKFCSAGRHFYIAPNQSSQMGSFSWIEKVLFRNFSQTLSTKFLQGLSDCFLPVLSIFWKTFEWRKTFLTISFRI